MALYVVSAEVRRNMSLSQENAYAATGICHRRIFDSFIIKSSTGRPGCYTKIFHGRCLWNSTHVSHSFLFKLMVIPGKIKLKIEIDCIFCWLTQYFWFQLKLFWKIYVSGNLLFVKCVFMRVYLSYL